MNDIESFSKNLTKDNNERETTISDNNRFDTSPMGVIVSPKKKLLIRSQSHTEPTSPASISTNQFSQSQKFNLDDENSMDDDNNNHCQRANDLPILTHTIDSNTQFNNSVEPSYTIQLRPNQNGVNPTMIKQQPIVFNNKRTFSQTVIGNEIELFSSVFSEYINCLYI
jgi:hypothetical protein